MLKIVLLLLSLFVFSSASDYSRANAAAKDAFSDLDCAFGECEKPAPEPKVIVKERVVVKEVPVVVEKQVVVEKVVYKEREPVKQEQPQVKKTPKKVVQQQPTENTNKIYNKAFFDVHARSQAPMLDYITYSRRASFDIKQYVDTVSKIKEEGTKVFIHGMLEVPASITTNQVYMNVGTQYKYRYYSYWKKFIYYNDSKQEQNSDYFLVDVKEDVDGNRYVKYKIFFYLSKPWKITASEENVAPNVFFFKMAPKVRGFKNKFISVKPYIIEE